MHTFTHTKVPAPTSADRRKAFGYQRHRVIKTCDRDEPLPLTGIQLLVDQSLAKTALIRSEISIA